jgi:hypothetical protein
MCRQQVTPQGEALLLSCFEQAHNEPNSNSQSREPRNGLSSSQHNVRYVSTARSTQRDAPYEAFRLRRNKYEHDESDQEERFTSIVSEGSGILIPQ